MATRSRTTFQKRQKELARMEKQRDKAARRQQRKLEKPLTDEFGRPIDEFGHLLDEFGRPLDEFGQVIEDQPYEGEEQAPSTEEGQAAPAGEGQAPPPTGRPGSE
jgi:hypothetical protein